MLFIDQHGTLNLEYLTENWKNLDKLTVCFLEYTPFKGESSLSLPNGEGRVIINTDLGVINRIRTYDRQDTVAFMDLIRSDFEGTSKLSGTDRVYSITNYGGVFEAQHYNNLGYLTHTVSINMLDDVDRIVTVQKFRELFPDCSHLYQRVKLLSTR
jgi:hypothetical protein